MKAIIMAGGEGTRLRPLTCDCPKPMMKLMNRPVMEYAVQLLKSHGITDIAVTLGYLPDKVTDHFGDGGDFGVNLRYYVEQTPLGTAGGVGQARDFLDETFIVLSGDGLTDLDITKAVKYHREKNALATLVLKTVSDPLEYGVAMTGHNGRITGFIEKPDPSNVFSAAANTGIYILEPAIFGHIPEGRSHDFGSQLFPALVRDGLPVYGYVMEGYWCDIGDTDAYIRAHADCMEGRVHLNMFKGGDSISKNADIHPSAVIESPVCIAEGVQVGENARIGPFSVIGPGCVVQTRASLKRGILLPGACLEEGSHARGCILGTNSRLKKGAQAYEGSVIGADAALGERSVLTPGTKLWPGKHTGPCERVEHNLVWGNSRKQRFSHGALPVGMPSQSMLACQAYVSSFHHRILLLGRTDSPISNVMWHAAAAGAMAQGVQVMDAGVCTLPVLRHAMKSLGCEGGALVTEDSFIPLQSTGAYLVSRQQRAMLALYARQDFPMPFSSAASGILPAGMPALTYAAEACRCFTADAERTPGILLYCNDAFLSELAASVFDRAGLKYRLAEDREIPAAHEVGLHLDPGGEIFRLSDHTGPLTEAAHQLFTAWAALRTGETHLLLPVYATRSTDIIAGQAGASTEYVGGEPLAWQSRLAEQHPVQFDMHFDGLRAALIGLSALVSEDLSLAGWRTSVPDVCRQNRIVSAAGTATGSILERFSRDFEGADPDCGIRFSRNDGWAWVCPEEDMTAFRIVTESASAETALELCDFCAKQIAEYAGNNS